MMNDVIILILSLSLSASVIAAILLAFRPLYRDRLAKSWQYYVWLVVVLRLLIPFAPEANLMGFLFGNVAPASQTVHRLDASPADAADITEEPLFEIGGNGVDGDNSAPGLIEQKDNAAGAVGETPSPSVLWRSLLDSLWMMWFIPALVLLVRSITNYNSFVRYILAGKEEIWNEEVLTAYQRACEESGVRRILPVYQNKLAASPMLVGILRPCIVLPVLALEAGEMQMVLRHELVHHRRRDLLYKWLTQLAVCLHWFNPLVYLVRREIGRACELSCDARVIAALPPEEKKAYGDILLASVKAGGSYSSAVASVTLTEDGREMKERLRSILNFRPNSRYTVAISAACSMLLLVGATFTGAYMGIAHVADSAELQAKQPVSEPPPSRSGDLQRSAEKNVWETVERDLEKQAEEGADKGAEEWADVIDSYDMDYWNEWADRWQSLWEEQWERSFKSDYDEDSWWHLDYCYKDGFFVGLGVKKSGQLEDYDRTESITVNGNPYIVAFEGGYETYVNESRVMQIIGEMIVEISNKKWQEERVRNAPYFVVRSVHFNTDSGNLLRQMYDEQGFVEFICLMEECRGMEVIEELLYRAVEERKSAYVLLLADLLPKSFEGGEALARKAGEYKDIILLEAMSPFIPSSLYESLTQEILQLPYLPDFDAPQKPVLASTTPESEETLSSVADDVLALRKDDISISFGMTREEVERWIGSRSVTDGKNNVVYTDMGISICYIDGTVAAMKPLIRDWALPSGISLGSPKEEALAAYQYTSKADNGVNQLFCMIQENQVTTIDYDTFLEEEDVRYKFFMSINANEKVYDIMIRDWRFMEPYTRTTV